MAYDVYSEKNDIIVCFLCLTCKKYNPTGNYIYVFVCVGKQNPMCDINLL